MLKKCPFCAEQIQSEAIKCRYCGEFLDGRRVSSSPVTVAVGGYPYGYEYRSKRELFGLPLLHVAYGIDPKSNAPRIAKGIIAIGNFAVGGLAIGGASLGVFAVGGVSLGAFALGGVAVGAIALGGLSIGAVIAVGGVALSFHIAVGGLAIAPHTIGGGGADPEAVRFFERWLTSTDRSFGGSHQH